MGAAQISLEKVQSESVSKRRSPPPQDEEPVSSAVSSASPPPALPLSISYVVSHCLFGVSGFPVKEAVSLSEVQ